MLPPGTHLLRIARTWFDEDTVTDVFEPLVADWQREWADARNVSPARRGSILLTGLAAFLRTLVICGGRDLMTLPDSTTTARLSVPLLWAIVAGIVLWVGPWLYFANRFSPIPVAPVVVGLMSVERAPVIWALSVLVGVAWLGRTSLARPGRAAIQLALIGVLGSFVWAGWLGPLANRELAPHAAEAHERGLDDAAAAGRFTLEHTVRLTQPHSREERVERRLTGMLRHPRWLPLQSLRGVPDAPAPPNYATLMAYEWHRRLQWPVLTCVLAWLGWVLAVRMTPSRGRIALWWTIASLLTIALDRLPTDLRLTVLGVWVPVLVFAAAAALLRFTVSSRPIDGTTV